MIAPKQWSRRPRLTASCYRAIVETALDPIAMVGPDGIVRFVSPTVEKTLGWRPMELIGKQAFDFVHPADLERARRSFERVLEHSGAVERLEVRARHASGDWRLLDCTTRNLLGDERVGGVLVQARDARVGAAAGLGQTAAYDTLTGLATRDRFVERLEAAASRPSLADKGRPVVLALDLDRLKLVNDSIGHAAGDAMLLAVARRLSAQLEAGDVLARLGSDEFGALLWHREDPLFGEKLVCRIQEAFREPFLIAGREVFMSLCIGAASVRPDAAPQDVLLDADLALARAKAKGPGSYIIFEDEMRTAAFDRLDVESRLRRALERDELRLYFQPIFSLETGEAVGHEALVRWMHPQRGLLGPEHFIPVAEETGLIMDVGCWVLEQACAVAGAWLREGRIGADHSINVNVSARQLQNDELADRVAAALALGRMPAHMLTIELTESAVVDCAANAAAALGRLRDLGVRVAIDDFGTGYSSLGYLHELPADIVKIDRCFISGSWRGGESLEVLTAILQLARELDLRVVAEGVETEAQCTRLRDLGCELAQGFFFARPAPARWQTALRPVA